MKQCTSLPRSPLGGCSRNHLAASLPRLPTWVRPRKSITFLSLDTGQMPNDSCSDILGFPATFLKPLPLLPYSYSQFPPAPSSRQLLGFPACLLLFFFPTVIKKPSLSYKNIILTYNRATPNPSAPRTGGTREHPAGCTQGCSVLAAVRRL